MSLTPEEELLKCDKNSNRQWDEIPSTAHLLDRLTSSYGQELPLNERVHHESSLTRAQKLFQKSKDGIWTSFHMKK